MISRFFLVGSVCCLILFSACSQGLKTIPEVSPDITHSKIFEDDLSDSPLGYISHRQSVYVIFKSGIINRFDIVSKKINSQYRCRFELEAVLRKSGHILALSKSGGRGFCFFDMEKMRLLFESDSKAPETLLHLDSTSYTYQQGTRIHIMDFNNRLEIAELTLENPENVQCFSDGEGWIIVSSDKLFKVDRDTKAKRTMRLSDPIASLALKSGDQLFYCSKDRFLVSYSIQRQKNAWRFKLPAHFAARPVKAKEYIAVLLKDYHLYFFNRNGSLYWWSRLGTMPFLPLLPMDENIAIALRPRKNPSIKFFNIREKKISSYSIGIPFRTYSAHQKQLYCVAEQLNEEDGDNGYQILEVGNKFDLDITIGSDSYQVKGKVIEFQLNPINLIKPEFEITILDSEKKAVYSHQIRSDKYLRFFWLPRRAGDYEVQVLTRTQNRGHLKTNRTFTVLDWEQMQNEFYYRIYINCLKSK